MSRSSYWVNMLSEKKKYCENRVTLRGSFTSYCWSDWMFLKGVNIRFVPDECWFMADLRCLRVFRLSLSHTQFTHMTNSPKLCCLLHCKLSCLIIEDFWVFGLIEFFFTASFYQGYWLIDIGGLNCLPILIKKKRGGEAEYLMRFHMLISIDV